jgi:hydrogenase maturation protease
MPPNPWKLCGLSTPLIPESPALFTSLGRKKTQTSINNNYNFHSMKKILILGIGHWLMGDDSLGPQVIQQLKNMKLSPDVELAEIGPAVIDALPLMENRKKIIIVDALRADEPPGAILRIPAEELLARNKDKLSLHQMNIIDVLKLSAQLGHKSETIIIGIVIQEPPLPSDKLSEQIKKNIPSLIRAILKEISSSKIID